MGTLQQQINAGQAVYTPFTLKAYDVVVHGLTSPLVWGCPTETLIDWHRRHVGRRHCEVGVGTGFMLDRAHAGIEQLTLVDLNLHCLRATAARHHELMPRSVQASVLEPLPDGLGPFDSIGLGHVLNCVPGELGAAKARAFDHLGRVLDDDGVLFGSTILADAPSLRARALMALYNRRGIFHNADDTMQGLVTALASRFQEHEIHRVGVVALFAARGYRG